MPSDITGTDILEVDDNTGKKEYRFIKGPIFTQMLLADEINRTPPKTQAALLEAQFDRFMFSVYIDYPTEDEEETIAKVTTAAQNYTLNKILNAREIIELQNAVRDLPVSDHVVKYAVRLVRATRPADSRAPDFIKKWIHCGSGPRAAHYLLLGEKARAAIDGHPLVTADFSASS